MKLFSKYSIIFLIFMIFLSSCNRYEQNMMEEPQSHTGFTDTDKSQKDDISNEDDLESLNKENYDSATLSKDEEEYPQHPNCYMHNFILSMQEDDSPELLSLYQSGIDETLEIVKDDAYYGINCLSIDLNHDGEDELISYFYSSLYNIGGYYDLDIWKKDNGETYYKVGSISFNAKGFDYQSVPSICVTNNIVNGYHTILTMDYNHRKSYSSFYYFDGNQYINETFEHHFETSTDRVD